MDEIGEICNTINRSHESTNSIASSIVKETTMWKHMRQELLEAENTAELTNEKLGDTTKQDLKRSGPEDA